MRKEIESIVAAIIVILAVIYVLNRSAKNGDGQVNKQARVECVSTLEGFNPSFFLFE